MPNSFVISRRCIIAMWVVACLSTADAQSAHAQSAGSSTDEPTFSIPEKEQPFWDSAQKFLDAYTARDAAAIGELFTDDAEFLDEFGVRTHGREEIVARFREVFDANAGARIEAIDLVEVRYFSETVALEQGFVVAAESSTSPRAMHKYAAIHVKGDDGVWRIDVLKDFPREALGRGEQLAQLSWMVGNWMSEDSESIVRSSCDWTEDGNYLLRKFTVHLENGLELQGEQRIGWDPVRQKLRSWIFDSEGGFFTGVWTQSGDEWLLTSTGVTGEGETVTSTAVYQIVDAEMLIWRYKDLIVGDVVWEEIEPVTMVRQPPAPSLEADSTVSR